MSGFRLTGGSQRGGKMAEAARAMGDHEMERREAALRAAATHLGWTVEDIAADPEKRKHIVQEQRLVRAGDEAALTVPQWAVVLDGVPVWRGGWRWEGYTASWHEEPLTEWMAAALASPPPERADE